MEIIKKMSAPSSSHQCQYAKKWKLSIFMRVMTQPYSEGVHVETVKTTPGSLAKEIENQAEGVLSMEKSRDDLVLGKKQSIESTINYLLNN